MTFNLHLTEAGISLSTTFKFNLQGSVSDCILWVSWVHRGLWTVTPCSFLSVPLWHRDRHILAINHQLCQRACRSGLARIALASLGLAAGIIDLPPITVFLFFVFRTVMSFLEIRGVPMTGIWDFGIPGIESWELGFGILGGDLRRLVCSYASSCPLSTVRCPRLIVYCTGHRRGPLSTFHWPRVRLRLALAMEGEAFRDCRIRAMFLESREP